jgi:hypothetical protein
LEAKSVLPRPASRLDSLEVSGRLFSGALIGFDLEGKFLTLYETAHAGTLESRRMDEYILAAILGLDKTITLVIVVEFHDSLDHLDSPLRTSTLRRAQKRGPSDLSIFGKKTERALDVQAEGTGIRPKVEPLI